MTGSAPCALPVGSASEIGHGIFETFQNGFCLVSCKGGPESALTLIVLPLGESNAYCFVLVHLQTPS